ncbi:MAG TPA: HEAT repeat domain-containing protein [bacterium]|nr:HEAT repeat domain-containing protein [bacterium]
MTNIFPTFHPTAIASSLQAAASRMTGTEFSAFTERVRDHLVAGGQAKLSQLLAGQGIEPSRKVLGQIAFARAFFFDEAIPAKMLSMIAEAPPAAQARAEMRVLQNIEALQSPHPQRRKRAADFFYCVNAEPRAVEPLITALGDVDSRVRRSAAWALGELGDPRAVEPLIKALGDVDALVREDAALFLGELGDPRALKPLIKALDDLDNTMEFRKIVAQALDKIREARRKKGT